MPVVVAQSSSFAAYRASLAERDLNASQARASRQIIAVARKLNVEVLAAFRAAEDPASRLRAILAGFSDTLTEAMVDAYLRGQLRAVDDFIAGSGDKKLVYHFASQASMLGQLDLTSEDLAAIASACRIQADEAVDLLTKDAGKLVKEVADEAISKGMHVEAGIANLRDKMHWKGIGHQKPWLLDTWYRTQGQMAYAAGRERFYQDPALQEVLWGYEYVTAGDDRVRANHVALDGTKLPKDDPRWAEITPPNGWNCRCQKIGLYEPPEDGAVWNDTVEVDGISVKPGADDGFRFNPVRVSPSAPSVAVKEKVIDAATVAAEKAARHKAYVESNQLHVLSPVERAERLVYDSDLGGTTGAKLHRDTVTGEKWVVKHGAAATNGEQALVEALSNDLYREMNLNAPLTYVVEVNGKKGMMSAFQKGKVVSNEWANWSVAERDAFRKAFQDGFVRDAWLANWDVVGTGKDNLIKYGNQIFRIDNGGSLYFRAQGGLKPFGAEVKELVTMRNPSYNVHAADMFKGLKDADVAKQVNALAKVMTNEKIEAVVARSGLSAAKKAEVGQALIARRDWMVKWAKDYTAHEKAAAKAVKDAAKKLKAKPPGAKASDFKVPRSSLEPPPPPSHKPPEPHRELRTDDSVEDLKYWNQHVKPHLDAYDDSLSDTLFQAAREYKGDKYVEINAILRGTADDYIVAREGRAVADYTARLDRIFETARLNQAQLLYRGGHIETIARNLTIDSDMARWVGQTFTDKGFASCSMIRKRAADFMGSKPAAKRVTFRVHVKARDPAYYIDGGLNRFKPNGREGEVLLRRDQTYKVLAAENMETYWLIDVELV